MFNKQVRVNLPAPHLPPFQKNVLNIHLRLVASQMLFSFPPFLLYIIYNTSSSNSSALSPPLSMLQPHRPLSLAL
jgi:hypothetical protein